MKLGTLDETISDMKSGVQDFTVGGECSNCGQCCSDFLPMTPQEVAKVHAFVNKNGIKLHTHCPPTNSPVQDLTCPFRDDMLKKCDIYPVRPAVCRDFRCDKPKDEIERTKRRNLAKNKMVWLRKEFG